MTERKLVKQFDQDGDKRLNREERAAAREFIKKENANRPARGGFPGGPGPGPGGPDARPREGNPPGDLPPGGPGFGPGFGRGQNQEPPKPGARISPAEVVPSDVSALYAPNVVRTLFLDFEGDDWERELADFNNTDVEVPATLTVDGEKYPGVGVHFRGMSSFMMVREGRKRSLNVSLDFTDKKQRLDGYKTLNLLNANGDSSMMSTVLYSEIARQYIPAPKANFARVVINGENWGIYTNVQQFNKDFVQENFRAEKGARWKVKGSPGGGGGLEYLGDDVAEYRRRYELKTDEDEEDWEALIQLCKVLKETPPEKLEAALQPLVDLDNLLWFLALDCTLINSDGYWVRASDYSLYRDKHGKFHFIPHDMNEALRAPGGPGMGRPGGRRGRNVAQGPGGAEAVAGGDREPRPPFPGSAPGEEPRSAGAPARPGQPGEAIPPGGPERRENFERGPLPPGGFGPGGFAAGPAVKGVELDPLVGLDDEKKPLRSRVLAVPSLRARYLAKVRTIADEWLDWKKLGPIVAQYRGLIEKEVAAETRNVTTLEGFQKATADTAPAEEKPQEGGGRREMSLRAFAEQRRVYLLSHPEIQKLPQ